MWGMGPRVKCKELPWWPWSGGEKDDLRIAHGQINLELVNEMETEASQVPRVPTALEDPIITSGTQPEAEAGACVPQLQFRARPIGRDTWHQGIPFPNQSGVTNQESQEAMAQSHSP